MKLLEYKAKELFKKFGLTVMNSCLISDLANFSNEVSKAELSFPVAVKAQVQVGGRGKAGGIRFADDKTRLEQLCGEMLHMELLGHTVNSLLIEDKACYQSEWYLSIVLDRQSKCPMIIFSSNGGMDIEEVAITKPEAVLKVIVDPFVGIQEYMAQYLISAAGLQAENVPLLYEVLFKLYRLFIEYDCLLCEINPLVSAKNGLIALDGKVDIDDSALFRQQDIEHFRNSLPEDSLVKEAREFGFLYIPIEKQGHVSVCSNGSGMLMSCIDMISKEGMLVKAALDLGGGATADRIAQAIGILILDGGVKEILINIFGGITRCDEVALGILKAFEAYHIRDKYIVVRMEGTNKEEGIQILKSMSGADVELADGLRESVSALLRRRSAR